MRSTYRLWGRLRSYIYSPLSIHAFKGLALPTQNIISADKYSLVLSFERPKTALSVRARSNTEA